MGVHPGGKIGQGNVRGCARRDDIGVDEIQGSEAAITDRGLVARRQIALIERCGHQQLAERGHMREPLPFREAQYHRLGLAVAGDDGGLAAHGVIDHRRQAGLGVTKLDFTHGGLRTKWDYSGHI